MSLWASLIALAAAVAAGAAETYAKAGSGTASIDSGGQAILAPAPAGSTAPSEGNSRTVPGTTISVRRLFVGADHRMTLVVPDGDGRIVLDNEILSSTIRIGTHYNFLNGKIRAWISYMMPIAGEALQLTTGAMDEVGLGNIYRLPNDPDRRFFERTQSIPLGLTVGTFPGSWTVSARRMYWRFGPLDLSQLSTREIIDSVSLQVKGGRSIADIAGAKAPDETSATFRHAFRDFGGHYRFDKIEADIYWRLPEGRPGDEWRLRTFIGQAYNVFPELPLREKYTLGGARALKGYRYQEFLGNGALMLGTEYAFGLPLAFSWEKSRLNVRETAFLAFFEEGRIQDRWFVRPDPLKWSGGIGLRFRGAVFGQKRTTVRFYLAQAGEIGDRAPVFYALADFR